MRRSDVESQFLASFGTLFPQFSFRGLRRFPGRTHGPISLALRLALEGDGREVDLLCAPLTEGTPDNVQRVLEQLRKHPEATANAAPLTLPALVAPYIGQQAQDICRQTGTGFFDLAGNASLAAPGLYVNILGRRNSSPRHREGAATLRGQSRAHRAPSAARL